MPDDPLLRDLRRCLAVDDVLDSAGSSARYEHGYRYGRGTARAIVRPRTTEQVADVIRYCYRNDLRIVPQGANTGLVAASTPDASGDQIVLSLECLAGVTAISSADRIASVRAGTRLSTLNRELAAHDLCFPIDLGADPSIGGMIATNTGGSRLLRYGDVQRNLLGLEAVLADADATVLRDLKGLRKDNSGLDAKQLFVGTGGAFGVITLAQVEVHRRPEQVAAALVVPEDHSRVPRLLARLEADAGEFLTAFEGMSANALRAALGHAQDARNPFDGSPLPDYCVLIELSSTMSTRFVEVETVLGDLLTAYVEGGAPLISDARLGRSEELWRLRHSVSDGVRALGNVIAFDISVQRGRLPALRADLLALLASHFPFLEAYDFGHCGDGGDHFNLVWPHGSERAYDVEVVNEVRRQVYEIVVARHDGSFSAEHGVGPYNAGYYRRYASAEERALAGRIKAICDPRRLLGTWDPG